MPRKASDSTVTHRIELGLTERAELKEIIKTQKENQRLDAITASMQAVGMAIGGIGALGAGLALAAWLAPGLVQTIKDKAVDAVDSVTSTGIDVLNEVLPDKAQIVTARTIKDEYDELRAKERASNGRKVYYCTPSSIGYNEQQCQVATDEHRQDRKEIEDYIERMKALAQSIKDGKLRQGAEAVNPFVKFMPGGSVWD
jgi:hypothetical protein